MSSLNLEKYVAGSIDYNRDIARELGIEASIIFGNIVEKHIRFNSEYSQTREEIQFETSLTPHQQRKAEKKLVEAGLIIISRKGLPAKNFYKLNKGGM